MPWLLGAGRISQSALVDYDITRLSREQPLLHICKYSIVYFVDIIIVMIQNDQSLRVLYCCRDSDWTWLWRPYASTSPG